MLEGRKYNKINSESSETEMSELHAPMQTGSEMETSHGGSPYSKKTSFRFCAVTIAGASILSV